MTQEKIIDRIRKLLALAGNNPNEAEAAAAADKVQALLAEYNLSMSDVSAKAQSEDQARFADFVTDSDLMTDSLPWRRQLGTMVAKMYFCDYLFSFFKKSSTTRSCGYIRYDKHYFVGARHNVEVAKVMFQYLNETIERLADQGALEWPMKERTPFRTAFKAACARRVCIRIRERIDAAKRGEVKSENTGTTLPALASLYNQNELMLKAFLQKQFGKLKSSADRARPSHSGGSVAGDQAGRSIGLDQQVGRSNHKLLS